jgi:tetratricopeptide (TPR) repeat protein
VNVFSRYCASIDRKSVATAEDRRVMALPPQSVGEGAECGRRLLDEGRIDNAEELYASMTQAFPRDPRGLVGLAQVAMRRKQWTEALATWDRVMDTVEGIGDPHWRAARATVLAELGQVEAAEAVLADLRRESPDEPAGYAGAATIAFLQRRWQETLERCDELLRKFGDRAAAEQWKATRASALFKVGRAGEAEAAAEEVIRAAPDSLPPLALLLRIYAATGRHAPVLWAIDSSPFRQALKPVLVEARLDALIRLGRFDEAGAFFRDALNRADQADTLTSLFGFIPAVYDGYGRQHAWSDLLTRSRTVGESINAPGQVALNLLQARIRLALRDRAGVLEGVQKLPDQALSGAEGDSLRRVAAVLSEAGYPDYDKPKIFGIGLSKTGTTTLAAAVKILGFHTLHWRNPLTGEVISEADFPLFDAFFDTPVSFRFETLYYLFPNSKFIFSTRPYRSWLKSMTRHWQRHLGISDFLAIKTAMARPGAFHHGTEFRSINRTLYFNYASYRDAFETYRRRVRSFFRDKPPERFLQMDIFSGDGWDKLCRFVGREVPARPFPWENRAPDSG